METAIRLRHKNLRKSYILHTKFKYYEKEIKTKIKTQMIRQRKCQFC